MTTVYMDKFTGETWSDEPDIEPDMEDTSCFGPKRTPDMEILLHVFRCPPRTKSDFARDHLNALLRLVETGLVTVYDPVERQYGSTFYLSAAGSSAVWAASKGTCR